MSEYVRVWGVVNSRGSGSMDFGFVGSSSWSWRERWKAPNQSVGGASRKAKASQRNNMHTVTRDCMSVLAGRVRVKLALSIYSTPSNPSPFRAHVKIKNTFQTKTKVKKSKSNRGKKKMEVILSSKKKKSKWYVNGRGRIWNSWSAFIRIDEKVWKIFLTKKVSILVCQQNSSKPNMSNLYKKEKRSQMLFKSHVYFPFTLSVKKKKDNRFTRVSWWPTQWCHLVGRKCVKLDWNGKPDSNANAAATLFDLTHTLLILDGDNPLNVCVCIMQKWESVLFPVL